jgi:hypothetical protein
MATVPIPDGYDVSKQVQSVQPDCVLTVGFDRRQYQIRRFLVRLHSFDTDDSEWTTVAQFDHNEVEDSGHDVYVEGLHVDVYRKDDARVKLRPYHGHLDPDRGSVVRSCVAYLDSYAEYFLRIHEGKTEPDSLPEWPDGGYRDDIAHRYKSAPALTTSRMETDDRAISKEELTALLARTTGTDAAEIDRRAAELSEQMDPPAVADAEVVER